MGRRVLIGGVGVLVLFGAYTVGRLALAERYRVEASDALQTDPARAFEKAEDSLGLNAASLPTYYIKAAAYARFNRSGDARRTLEYAASLEPHDFVPWVLMGDLSVRRGDIEAARTAYGRASKLNPQDAELIKLAADPREALKR